MNRRVGAALSASWFALLPGFALAADKVTLAEAAPEDTIVFASIDVERAMHEYPSLDAVRLFHDEEVQAFLAPALAALRADRDWRELQAALFMLQAYGLPEIIGGKVSIALIGAGIPDDAGGLAWYSPARPPTAAEVENEPPFVLPDLVLEIETAGRVAFESSLQRVLELDPDIVTRDLTGNDILVKETTIDLGGLPLAIYHGFVGDSFVAALRESRVRELAKALTGGGAARSLAKDAAFGRWRDVSTRQTDIAQVYLGVGWVMQALAPLLSDRERQDVQSTGADAIQGGGIVLGIDDGRLRDSLSIVLSGERRGVFRLLDAFGADSGVASGIPAESQAAIGLQLDGGLLLDRGESYVSELDSRAGDMIDRQLKDVGEDLGFDIRRDLLGSLGTGLSIAAQLPRSGFIPEVTGALAVRDAERFMTCLAKLKELVTTESGGQVAFADLALGDDPAFYMKIDGAPISPSFCLKGDRLLFALAPNTLKKLVKSTASSSLAENNADFARCVATTVGQQFADVRFMLYFDLARIAQYGLGMAGMFLPQIAAEAPFELDPALFPLPETIAGYLSGALLTLRIGQDSVALDSSCPFGGILLPTLFGVVGVSVQQREQQAMFEQMRILEAESMAVATGDPDAPFLGINYDQNQTSDGVTLLSVIEGAPAEQAGLIAADIIVAVDGVAVSTAAEFSAALRAHAPGDTVVVEVLRNGESQQLPVVLGRRGDYVR